MRSGLNGIVVTGVLLLLLCLGSVALACSLSFRGTATYTVDALMTREARPQTVGERAAAIREETRLDNPNGVPVGFWFVTIGSLLLVVCGTTYLVLGKEFFQAKAESLKQHRLLGKAQRKRGLPDPSPYHVIEQPLPQQPQVPLRPRLPGPPSVQQLEGGRQG